MITAIVPYSKTIPLTQGKEAIVGYWWHPFISIWKWHAHLHHGNWYATRSGSKRLNRRLLRLHRIIMGITNPNILVDHKDLNGLNNTESNLRTSTVKQNCRNTRSRKGSTSKFLGVSKITYKSNNKSYWRSQITHDRKNYALGQFPFTPCGELLAAISYDKKAEELFGEFANLNFSQNAA